MAHTAAEAGAVAGTVTFVGEAPASAAAGAIGTVTAVSVAAAWPGARGTVNRPGGS